MANRLKIKRWPPNLTKNPKSPDANGCACLAMYSDVNPPSSVSHAEQPPGSQRPSRWSMIALAVVLVVVASLLAAQQFGFLTRSTNDEIQHSSDSMSVRRLPVAVITVRRVNRLTSNRKYTGIIRPKLQADLAFESAGRIDKVLFDEGDSVLKGQVLAQLDTDLLTARRAAMQASWQQAQAVLEELQAGPRKEVIASTEALLEEARSNLKLAELNYERRKKLQGSEAVSTEDFERALYSLRGAKSRLDATAKQLEELHAGTRPEQIAAQRAAVDQLKASLDEIDIQIRESALRAPFAGTIVRRISDPGTIATPAQPVLQIVDSNKLEALIGVPLNTARELEIQNTYQVIVNNKSFAAVLLAKIPQLQSATRTQNLILELAAESDAGQLVPGQLCQIEIPTEIDTEGFWVPSSSLANGIRGLWSVLMVDEESRIRRLDVQVIHTDGEQVLVTGAIEDGAQIVCDGTHRIVEGQWVETIPDKGERR
jgi:multidrug efflux pump subunit AcrA (membrane-fusion protein)